MASRSDLSGKRVLVTGASGFTGRYVIDQLKQQGCEVIGLGSVQAPVPSWAGGLRTADDIRPADLRDLDGLRKVLQEVRPDVVVHLAALAFVGHGLADDFYNVNLLGTRNLLQAVDHAALAPDRVLLASSANVYGNSQLEVLDEASPPSPANDYAISKLGMEYVARLWHERLPITIVRPFNYTGRGQAENFLIPKIVSHFIRRAPVIELGNLDVARDFGDVRSVSAAYLGLLESGEAVGQTVNVCSGIAHSLQDVIALCSEITGHSISVSVNPAFVRQNEVKVLRGDSSLLHSMVPGWSSIPLRDTLDWMLSMTSQDGAVSSG